MNFKKVKLIIGREFSIRVKKKSFIITTLLIPVFLAGFMVVPTWLATLKDSENKKIVIIDHTAKLTPEMLKNTEELTFRFEPQADPNSYKEGFGESGLYAIVVIDSLKAQGRPLLMMYSGKQIGLEVQEYIGSAVEKMVQEERLKTYQIENLDTILAAVRAEAKVKTMLWSSDGEEKESQVFIYMAIAYISSFFIYMFIFMFGNMVMRGVIEEKTNRIVEVIISSVKPIELMMGKIIGVACVALLQFAIWICLTLGIVTVVQLVKGGELSSAMTNGAAARMGTEIPAGAMDAAQSSIMSTLSSVNFPFIILSLICYFVLGYLLYASMFAAIGSAVDNETDTQQLVLPITMPLILGIFIMMHACQHPDSTLSFWGSMIPFTSPMVMMARVPFGVPWWQWALSLSLLLATFIGIVAFSAKIYRVGILMYGKKASWKEMWKWMRYKN